MRVLPGGEGSGKGKFISTTRIELMLIPNPCTLETSLFFPPGP